MPLAEGVQVQIAYKAYATGVIDDDSEEDVTSAPGAGSAKITRRVSSQLELQKDTYQSNEILSSRQLVDYRHGGRRVIGGVSGEYSPATYFEWIEAALRGTAVSAITLTQVGLTSLAADSTLSKFTAAAGDPVALGLRVGHIIRLTGMTQTANNDKNFLITGFSGTSNRVIAVSPAPVTEAADTSFSLVRTGKDIMVPTTGHVSRKFALEHNYQDIDLTELFTECRIAGFNMQLPATGIATFDTSVMGRNKLVYAGSDSPYFTSPAAATTTGTFQAVNGSLLVDGSLVGVVTGLNISLSLNPSGPAVIGQNFAPEIFLGKANVTGQVTAFLKDGTLLNDFIDETEISIQAFLKTTSAANSPANSILLPRVKFSRGAVAVQGESGQILNLPFQALYYNGAAIGMPATTIQIQDTEAA